MIRYFFRPTRRIFVWLLLLVLLVACGFALALNTGAFSIASKADDAQIHLWIERGWISAGGDCVALGWKVEGIREIYLDDQSIPAEGNGQICANQASGNNFRIVLRNGDELLYDLDPRMAFLSIKALGTLAFLLVVIGLADYFIHTLPSRPDIRLTSESTTRVAVYHMGFVILGLIILALIFHFLPSEDAVGVGAKLILSSLVLGVAPGILLYLLLWPMPEATFFDLIGIGLPISLGIIEILTIISIVFHIGSQTILGCYLFVLFAASIGMLFWLRSKRGSAILLPRRQVFLGLLLIGLACVLYAKGSPILAAESQIHASIVGRLESISAPSFNNIYTVPGVAYTNPLPGTQYFMAMVSNLSGLDALFVYDKLRFLWGTAAIVLLYLLSEHIFRNSTIASVTVVIAVLFVLNGTFADVPGLYWGQLATTSHPSDVPISVYLPALILISFLFIDAHQRRASLIFFAGCLLVGLLIICAHVREMVQMLVYLGSFFLALLLFRREKVYLFKTVILIAVFGVMLVSYVSFQNSVAPDVATLNQNFHTNLLKLVNHFSLVDFFVVPWTGEESLSSLFYGWNGIILLVTPLVFLIFRKNKFMLFLGPSVFAYLLLVRFPIFSIPYTYFTVYEILSSPARNITTFVYLTTGAFFYLLATNIARIPKTALAFMATVAVSLIIVWLLRFAPAIFGAQNDFLFLPTIFAFALIFLLYCSRWAKQLSDRLQLASSRNSWQPIMVIMLIPVIFLTAVVPSSPFVLGTGPQLERYSEPRVIAITPVQLIDTLECLNNQGVLSCPPTLRLVTWIRRDLPVQAVLATNNVSLYALNPFIPQQTAAWSLNLSYNISDPRGVFPTYFNYLDQAIAQHRVQPFFNTEETLSERRKFLGALHATYVVLDPMYYTELKQTLAQWPDVFTLLYDAEKWAVYKVNPIEF